jgi:hypothetical protein
MNNTCVKYTCSCNFESANDVYEALVKIANLIQCESIMYIRNAKYGYEETLDNRHLKFLSFVRKELLLYKKVLQRHYEILLNNETSYLECSELTNIYKKIDYYVNISGCQKFNDNTIRKDYSKLPQFIANNPGCYPREVWENAVCNVPSMFTKTFIRPKAEILANISKESNHFFITLQSKPVDMTSLHFNLVCELKDCTLHYKILSKQEETLCKIDYNLLKKEMPSCELTYDLFKDAYSCGLNYKIVKEILSCNLSFKLKEDSYTLCITDLDGNEISLEEFLALNISEFIFYPLYFFSIPDNKYILISDIPFENLITFNNFKTNSDPNASTFFNSQGYLEVSSAVIAEIRPNFEYLNPSNYQGLIVEPQATNYLLYSRDLTNAAWIKNAQVDITLQATGLDNNPNVASVVTSTGANAIVSQAAVGVTPTNGVFYTLSAYIKRISGTSNVYFSIEGPSSTNWQLLDLTNQYQLFTITSDQIINAAFKIEDAGTIIEIDAVQIELGSFASSRILTTNTTLTRPEDRIYRNGLSAFIGNTQGSVFAELVSEINDTITVQGLTGNITPGINRVQFVYSQDEKILYINDVKIAYEVGNYDWSALGGIEERIEIGNYLITYKRGRVYYRKFGVSNSSFYKYNVLDTFTSEYVNTFS